MSNASEQRTTEQRAQSEIEWQSRRADINHKCAEERWAEIERLRAALREIETICTESAGDCRRRMGTRVGNSLVTARKALGLDEYGN